MGQVSTTGFQIVCPSLNCFLRASPKFAPLLDLGEPRDAHSPPEGAMNCQWCSSSPPRYPNPHLD